MKQLKATIRELKPGCKRVLQMNNDPKNTIKLVTKWLKHNKINVLEASKTYNLWSNKRQELLFYLINGFMTRLRQKAFRVNRLFWYVVILPPPGGARTLKTYKMCTNRMEVKVTDQSGLFIFIYCTYDWSYLKYTKN